MKVFLFGVQTYKRYGGNLIEIKIIAEDRKMADEMIQDIIKNSKCIDEDEWYALNDMYDY